MAPLKFIDRGIKINQQLYLNDVLKSYVKANADGMFGDRLYTFRQDSPPTHKGKTIQVWCEINFPCFIPVSEWPIINGQQSRFEPNGFLCMRLHVGKT